MGGCALGVRLLVVQLCEDVRMLGKGDVRIETGEGGFGYYEGGGLGLWSYSRDAFQTGELLEARERKGVRKSIFRSAPRPFGPKPSLPVQDSFEYQANNTSAPLQQHLR